MIQVDTVKISLPLKQKFVTSKGEASVKTNLLTILNNRYNGEAAASVACGPTMDQIEADIKRGVERLTSIETIDVETLKQINDYDIHPIARSALIAMVLNYLSGETGKYPWEVLSIGGPVGIKSSITVSVGEPSETIEAIKQSQYPIVKVKLGGEYDMEVVEALKEISDKVVRVDANGGWSCERAEEMIFYLSRAGVRVIEQPTDVEHVKEWQHLKGKDAEVELILDEGLNTLDDYKAHKEFVDGVNIKMEKSGGIIEAIRIAQEARSDKKKVMLGCMVESSVGIAQSLYMSSLADYHDLDGPQLLEDDIASGIRYERETIEVDQEIIGGPKLKRDIVEKYIQH